MNRLNTLCLDDELPALRLLAEYCSETPETELLCTFSKPQEAFEYLRTHPIDLLISDIQMPGLNGIELLKKLDPKPLCIFITADPGQAVTAFELDVIDYLVKPVSKERFQRAIRKAQEYHSFLQKDQHLSDYIMFKSDYKVNKVQLSEISHIEGMGEYLKIVTKHKNYMLLQRMSDFEQEHGKLGFIRIHKSYLVLKQHIDSLKANNLLLKNGTMLPIGRVYKSGLRG